MGESFNSNYKWNFLVANRKKKWPGRKVLAQQGNSVAEEGASLNQFFLRGYKNILGVKWIIGFFHGSLNKHGHTQGRLEENLHFCPSVLSVQAPMLIRQDK